MDLGLARAGFTHQFFCEADPYRRRVLSRHWPGVPVYEDVRGLTRETLQLALNGGAEAGGDPTLRGGRVLRRPGEGVRGESSGDVGHLASAHEDARSDRSPAACHGSVEDPGEATSGAEAVPHAGQADNGSSDQSRSGKGRCLCGVRSRGHGRRPHHSCACGWTNGAGELAAPMQIVPHREVKTGLEEVPATDLRGGDANGSFPGIDLLCGGFP